MLTDTHCHLDFEKFNADRADVLLRALRAGIGRILIPGLTLASSRSVLNLVEDNDLLFASVGVHPTEAREFDPSKVEDFLRLAGHSKVKAIGEIGLDYYWDASPHDLQRSVLKQQLELAARLHLPVIIHFREKGDQPDGPCAADLLKILGEWVNGLRQVKSSIADRPGVLHSFSGSLASALAAIDLGFFLGVTGPVTYSKACQGLLASLPLEKLLLETDAPFLAPAPFRGKRNEPANIRLIADKISELHARKPEEVAVVTSANASTLFRWDE